jgi:hypothetical protein
MKISTRLGVILIANKLSDVLLSAKTTLPVLLTSAGAPGWMSQLLVPIRESGALLPQMAYAYVLRNHTRRDRAWQLSMFVQFIGGITMVACGLSLEGTSAGVGVLFGLVCMSLSRALSSLTMKDIQGKHIDKGNRGRLIGGASTFSSLISIGVALVAFVGDSKINANQLIIVASVALLSKLLCMYLMRPVKTEVDTSERQVQKGLYIDKVLVKFVLVRSLLAHTALVAPLFILSYDGNLAGALAYFIVAQALASFVSSYLWGWLADVSALWCMRIGVSVATFAGLTLLFTPAYLSSFDTNIGFIAALYFILSIGHEGVRTGRKIYGVDIATEQHRTEFVASANTIVGGAIIVLGSMYSLISAYSSQLSLSLMLLAMTAGALGSFLLKKEK